MDITLNTCEWTEVTGLEDGKMYALQAKYIRRGISFPHNILFIRETSVPTQPHVGYIDNYIKFTKNANESVYIRTYVEDIQVHIERI